MLSFCVSYIFSSYINYIPCFLFSFHNLSTMKILNILDVQNICFSSGINSTGKLESTGDFWMLSNRSMKVTSSTGFMLQEQNISEVKKKGWGGEWMKGFICKFLILEAYFCTEHNFRVHIGVWHYPLFRLQHFDLMEKIKTIQPQKQTPQIK